MLQIYKISKKNIKKGQKKSYFSWKITIFAVAKQQPKQLNI